MEASFILNAPQHQDASDDSQLASTPVTHAVETSPPEPRKVARFEPKNSPPAASPAASTNKNPQAEAFREFIQKMSSHSEVLHREFNLLEQLAALHPNEAENTNHLVFQQMRLAFGELGRRAATNDNALQLLVDASKSQYLSGVAVAGIGIAAQNGNQKAIELLIEPEKNGWLLSSSAGALVNVARSGDDNAIAFMHDLTVNPKNSALWWFAAHGLAPAAEAGNEQAIEGLINMSGFENQSIQNEILNALTTAAQSGNQQAISALKSKGDTSP